MLLIISEHEKFWDSTSPSISVESWKFEQKKILVSFLRLQDIFERIFYYMIQKCFEEFLLTIFNEIAREFEIGKSWTAANLIARNFDYV